MRYIFVVAASIYNRKKVREREQEKKKPNLTDKRKKKKTHFQAKFSKMEAIDKLCT